MSQHDYIINNATFPNVRSDLNLALGAVATNNAGDDAPSTTYANQWWFDSNGNTLYMRNKDNDAWVTILTIGATSDTVTSVEGASTLAGIDDQSSSNDDQITITDTAVVINEDSDDLDFRVESNGNANAIFVNGGTDSVTIGASGVVQTVAGVPLYSADSSIYIGQDVSGTDDTAQFNVAIGFTTLDAITTGDSNVAIGYNAMTANTTGGSNISIGKSALGTNTTGSSNIAIGLDALLNPDTESHNLGIGNGALGGTISGGEYNVAVGNYTLDALTSGDFNTAVGYQAGSAITTGSNNTLLGRYSGLAIQGGGFNTCVGHEAGSAITSGSNTIMIGHDSGTSNSIAQTTTESNRIILGDNNITDFFCADSSISSSDKRDKTDIEDFSHGLNFIEQLQPKTYKWDKRAWYCESYPTVEQVLAATPDGSKKKNKLNIGFMAQDVQAIEEALGYKTDDETNLIFHKNDAMQVSLKYERLIPILVNAVKELSAEIKALKGE